MDSNLEAVLAAFPENAPETEAAPVAASEPEIQTQDEAPEVESNQDTPESEELRSKPDSELTPEQLAKRERNKESHLKSALARRQRAENARELRELREFKAQMEAAKAPAQESKKPVMDDFDDLDQYYDARDAYKEAQKLSAQKTPQIDLIQAHRAQETIQREAEFAKAAPDYNKLIGENADFFNEVGNDPKLQNAIMEAENAPLALYALMKEGLVDELYNLSPTRLAAELAKAEIRGQSYLVPKKTISTAPQPLATAKGTGLTTKPVSSMSFDELKKDLGIK